MNVSLREKILTIISDNWEKGLVKDTCADEILKLFPPQLTEEEVEKIISNAEGNLQGEKIGYLCGTHYIKELAKTLIGKCGCYPKSFCDICFTSSWAPVPKSTPNAQKVKDKDEWVICQLCEAERKLREATPTFSGEKEGKDTKPIPAEKKECFHEWEFYSTSTGNTCPDLIEHSYKCRKCGEYKYTSNQPEPKPKERIEELNWVGICIMGNTDTVSYITEIKDKLNTVIQRINERK
jgi:Icc-related predicted phosphoesterase